MSFGDFLPLVHVLNEDFHVVLRGLFVIVAYP